MVAFLKENGFHMTVFIETSSVGDEYESVITDEKNNVIGEFKHIDLRARIHWVNGFFTALRLNGNKRKL